MNFHRLCIRSVDWVNIECVYEYINSLIMPSHIMFFVPDEP